MGQYLNLTLFTIGVVLILGGGLFWVIGGELDCSSIKDNQKMNQCKSFTNITNYGLPAIIVGFMMMPMAIWVFSSNDNYTSTEKRKETVESPFKALPKGFENKDAV